MLDVQLDPGDPVALTQALIRCASITPASASVFDVLEAALAPLGFAISRLVFEGDGSYPVENLFATRGSAGKHLLFAGHTDVVPPGDLDAWTDAPFAAVTREGRIFGRGATDMKSGIAAFVAAAARCIGEGSADRGRISLAITNDEEADAVNGTEKLMAWAKAEGHRFDFAIVGEPSSAERLGDSIRIGRRGSLNGRIVVAGTQGHVAYPERANNPLPVAGALITALSQARLDDGNAHFPPSNLELTSADVGNDTTNVIPAKVLLRFNVRFNDQWSPATLKAWIESVIGGVDAKGTSIGLEFPGRAAHAFRAPLGGGVETLSAVIAARAGARPLLSTGGGTSDARFIAPYCAVVECGLPGVSMHQVDEWVAIEDVMGLSAIYADFIAAYFAERGH